MDTVEIKQPRPDAHGGGWLLGLLLAATLLIGLIHIDQPIVENYVGRQVPTAMVARNLERGSGLLRPQLDTAPFPNYFLVEPPLYEFGVVALKRISGLTLEQSGRALSALATTVAGWGLFELMRRRGCRRAALFAVGSFAVFPITIRYGRAFQPDVAMLGAAVAGLACWDRFESGGRRYWLVTGWWLLALGFAIKISAAFLLAPLVLGVLRTRRMSGILLACATLLPALLWYAWADHLVAGGSGSRASADNRAIWLGLLGPSALASRGTWELVFRFVFIRAFTPLGMILAVLGLVHSRAGGSVLGSRALHAGLGHAPEADPESPSSALRAPSPRGEKGMMDTLNEPSDREPVVKRSPSPQRGEGWGEGGSPRVANPIAKRSNRDSLDAVPSRLWWTWALAALATLAILAQKLHHEYYFLILAPAAAAGIGYALNRLAAVCRVSAFATFGVLIVLCLFQARSTWRMPDEWEGLVAASRAVAAETPADAWVVAPEALLFQADRRGCRLEWTPSSVRRAAGEWGASGEVQGPLDLVECYRRQGARYFADLGDRRADPRRMALHDSVRQRYKVIVDCPEVIIADLVVAGRHPHAQ